MADDCATSSTMPTPDDFRRIALSFEGAEERSHREHPDFRVKGKVFASLGYPDAAWAMVQLMPEQQEDFIALAPDAFRPANGDSSAYRYS